MINKFEGKYRFLSNFWPCKIIYNGVEYDSVECAYQANKVDSIKLQGAMATLAPATSKTVGGFLRIREDWEEVKVPIMLDLLRLKFNNPILKAYLLSTDTEFLVEGNYWHDNFWGICSCQKCPNNGENKLGQLLMQIRAELSLQ